MSIFNAIQVYEYVDRQLCRMLYFTCPILTTLICKKQHNKALNHLSINFLTK